MKFSYYSSLYLDFKKHELKYSTLDKYTNIVKDRINPFFADMNITDIKPSHVKKWLYSLDHIGSKSKRIYLSVMSGIMQEALFDEVIDRNPVKLVRLPKLDTPKIKPFSSLEVKKIMDYTKNDNFRFYLAVAFYTGMRSGEIIALKKSDIDLENSLISVRRTRSRFGESTPKTTYSNRQIPIIDSLKPYLLKMLQKHTHEYILVTQYGQPYNTTNVFQHDFWKPTLEALNIEYRRPYNARHTYATNMLYNNLVTPVQLAQLLGHANTQMVYDVYVNYIENFNANFDLGINIYS